MTIQTVLNVTQTSLVIDTAGHILGAREPYLYDDATISPANFAILQRHINEGRLRLLTGGITIPPPVGGASLVSVTVSGQNLVFTDSLGGTSTVAIPTQAAGDTYTSLLKVQAGNPDAMVSGTITRNTDGAATTFTVLWPDGATGTFTGAPSTAFPGAVDAWTITHTLNGTTQTYTQPTVTRDANGAVTNRPNIVVTDGLPPVAPPTTLTLGAVAGDGQVTVTPSGATGRTSYTLYRGTDTSGTQLTTTFAAYTDTGRTNGTAVNYYAVAANSGGQVTATASATPAATPVVPTAPTIAATAGDGQVTVTQTAAGSNVQSLSVRRNGTQVATALPYTDTGLTNGTTYTYTAVATSSTGNTATSNSVTATPVATPVAPTTAPALTLGTSTVTTQPQTVSAVSGATAYDYEHKASSGSTWTVDTTSGGTSYTTTGLTAATSYDYRSRARNTAGPGPYSTVQTKSTLASGGTPAPGTVYLADSFTGTDGDPVEGRTLAGGSDTSKAWAHQTDSRFLINTNSARAATGPTGQAAFATVNAGATAYKVAGTFAFLNSSTTARKIGLVFRFQDSANTWRVDPNGGTWLVRKIVAGTATTIITGPTAAANDVAEVTVGADNTISLTINGTAAGTAATGQTDLASAQLVGIYGQATSGSTGGTAQDQLSRIRNFAVTAV